MIKELTSKMMKNCKLNSCIFFVNASKLNETKLNRCMTNLCKEK